jgi:CheY-like chemotaxis protein
MNLTDDERATLRDAFESEVPRHLAALHAALRLLEESCGDARRTGLERLHAEAHAVRGAAALLGLVDVAERARLLERAAAGSAAERATAADQAARLVAALGSHRPATTGGEGDGAPPDRPLVLHVEDNEANRRLLAAVLAHRPDLGLLEAATGEEGLDLARTPGIVLVLLDLRLPGLSGEEVLARLRADPLTTGLRVVVVSAEARVDERDRLFAAGADDYIVKPYDVEHLLATLDAAHAARRPA